MSSIAVYTIFLYFYLRWQLTVEALPIVVYTIFLVLYLRWQLTPILNIYVALLTKLCKPTNFYLLAISRKKYNFAVNKYNRQHILVLEIFLAHIN